MDFFKQAASFVASNKAEESGEKPSGGGFDVNDVADLMSKAEGFLGENKPEAVAPVPVEEDEEEVVKKPSSEVKHEAPESTSTEEDTEKGESEKPASAETVKPTEPEEQDSPNTETKTTTATSAEVPPGSSKPEADASYSELYGSAQTLFSGLRGKLGGKTDVDDQELASAAEDLVKGAESHGLLKPENPYSGYFKKAENFLHDYGSSDSAPKKPSSDESA